MILITFSQMVIGVLGENSVFRRKRRNTRFHTTLVPTSLMWVEYFLSNQLSLTARTHFPESWQFDVGFVTTLQLTPIPPVMAGTGIVLDVLSSPRVG